MKLSELTIGRTGPSVSTIDRTAPFIKAGMKIAADRTKSMNSATSVKDKFEVAYDISKQSAVSSVILGKFSSGKIKSYDPASGDIIFAGGFNHGKLYSANINSYEYVGREKSISSNTMKYIFKEIVPPVEISADTPQMHKKKKKAVSNNDIFSAWGE